MASSTAPERTTSNSFRNSPQWSWDSNCPSSQWMWEWHVATTSSTVHNGMTCCRRSSLFNWSRAAWRLRTSIAWRRTSWCCCCRAASGAVCLDRRLVDRSCSRACCRSSFTSERTSPFCPTSNQIPPKSNLQRRQSWTPLASMGPSWSCTSRHLGFSLQHSFRRTSCADPHMNHSVASPLLTSPIGSAYCIYAQHFLNLAISLSPTFYPWDWMRSHLSQVLRGIIRQHFSFSTNNI